MRDGGVFSKFIQTIAQILHGSGFVGETANSWFDFSRQANF